ncbi:thymidine kinase [Reichenbachiella versicolor]|uniref:thymidine kinase n=1 Tax=Reichenbachiella versicolor TaxID=1821036 RepID=UPI000D6DF71C|nr:thymidine kinase [Reichenbachiella versicolor]
MFLESTIDDQNNAKNQLGWLEVICGSMFSGKTEELIRRLNRARIADQNVEIFKPAIDVRYSEEDVVSHNQNTIRSTPVQSASEILLLGANCNVVGIDEAQFFDKELVYVCRTLANNGKRVILAGLDMTFKGEPFEPMPQLMAIAEYVTKFRAICMRCGNVASYTYRTTTNDDQVLLGEQDKYEARCRTCFYRDFKNEK